MATRAQNVTANTTPYLLNIISTNRVGFPASSSTIYEIQFQYPVLFTNRVSLKTANVPNTIIVFNRENTYQYRVNTWIDFIDSSSTEKNAQIATGSYTESQLITEIQNKMNAASGLDTYTVTISPNTKIMTITSSSATFQLLFGTGTHASTTPSANKTAYYELGFNTADTATAAAISGVRAINISGPPSLFIQIDQLKNVIHDTNRFTASFQIPMDVSYGQIKYWKENAEYDTSFAIDLKNLTSLKIALVSDFGQVNLGNSDWGFMLEFLQE